MGAAANATAIKFTVDLDSLSFVERTFTFNDMLLATWSFSSSSG